MVCDVDVFMFCEKYEPGDEVVPASSQYCVTPFPVDQVNACDEPESVEPPDGDEIVAFAPPPLAAV